MTLRPRPTTLLAAALGLLLGACGGSLYDAAGVPKVEATTCQPGTHLCAGGCVADTDETACGASCTDCRGLPIPPSSINACVDQGAGVFGCGFTCTASKLACGGQCVDESPSACGTSCQVCTAPAGAVATCSPVTHACGFTCAPGLLAVGGECRAPTAVAAGGAHACALTVGGGLVCWGANDAGQLGAAGAGGPAPVTVFTSGATQVVAGGRHTCAIRGGSVSCWGSNASGQLGSGVGPGGPTPVTLTLAGASQLAAGGRHTCAVATAGKLWCWGANDLGQLGVGDLVAHPGVSAAPIASGVLQVVAAADDTCAIVSGAANTLRCWGANEAGQTGRGVASASVTSPVTVPLSPAVPLQAAVGTNHACAIVAPAGLYCWGENAEAQLGTGATGAPALTPVAAGGIDGGGGGLRAVVAVAGAAFTCTAKDQLEVKCAGRTDKGQAGIVSATPVLEGGPIGFGALWSQLGAGLDFACALVALAPDPGIKCWGGNGSGQLGRVTAQPFDATAGLVGQ